MRLANKMAVCSYAVVQSLKKSCLQAVAKQVNEHQNSLHLLPIEIKDKLVKLFGLRGLLSDEILPKLLTPSISELDLSGSNPTDSGLRTISRCKRLKKLDLNAVKDQRENISTEGIVAIANSCTKLQTVYLRRCVNIADEAIITLAQHCPYLQYLNIASCNVTDASLRVLAMKSKFLQSLNVSKTRVTDDGVTSLANGCCSRSLQEVHVAHCAEVSDDSLEAILMLCPQISILIFYGCPLVTERIRYAMEEVVERGGRLKQVSWTIY